MITVSFRSLKGASLQTLETFKSGSWIRVEAPTDAEIERIATERGLDAGHLRDALDPLEVPRLEMEGSAVYVFTRFPMKTGDVTGTVPLLVVYVEDAVITVCARELPELEAFIARTPDLYTTQKAKLLLQLFAWINQSYIGYLNAISRNIRSIGRQLQLEDIKNSDIAQFVVHEGVLQDFVTSLAPMNAVFATLLPGRHIHFFEEDKDLIEDLSLSTNQLIDACRSNLKSIGTIRDAYSTIMTNNLNRTIRFLTSLTVLLMVPNLVTGFYGMNIHLPYADSPIAATGIVVSILVMVGVLALVFIRNKWL